MKAIEPGAWGLLREEIIPLGLSVVSVSRSLLHFALQFISSRNFLQALPLSRRKKASLSVPVSNTNKLHGAGALGKRAPLSSPISNGKSVAGLVLIWALSNITRPFVLNFSQKTDGLIATIESITRPSIVTNVLCVPIGGTSLSNEDQDSDTTALDSPASCSTSASQFDFLGQVRASGHNSQDWMLTGKIRTLLQSRTMSHHHSIHSFVSKSR